MASQVSMTTIVEVANAAISSAALALSAVSGIDAADVEDADICWLQVQTGQVRFFTDGASPTVSTGWLLTLVDGFFPVAGNRQLAALELIRDGGGDATINIGLYKW